MGRVVVLLVLLCASGAHADIKADVEKLVQACVKAAAIDRSDDFEKTTAAARVIVLPNGKSSLDGKLASELYGTGAKKVTHKIDGLHVVVDAAKKLAWFHGAYTATFLGTDRKKHALPMRISGIVVDEGEPLGWKIQAVMFARTISEDELATRGIEAVRGAPKITGESSATKAVAAWFGEGGSIAGGRSKNVAIDVNGTSAAEIGNGPGALKLVGSWEAANMWATSIEATVYADNEIAFVRADMMLPAGKLAARLVLGIVLVKENTVWRWVTMSFSPVIDA